MKKQNNKVTNLDQRGEPMQSSLSHTSSGSSVLVGATLLNYFFSMPAGLYGRAKTVISANGPCHVLFTGKQIFSSSGFDKTSAAIPIEFGANGGYIIIPEFELYETGAIQVLITATTTADLNCSVGLSGVEAYQDFNFNAAYSYLQIGDSRQAANMGNISAGSVTNNGLSAYGRRLTEYLKSTGINIQLLQRGISGYSAFYYNTLIMTGRLDADIRKANIIEIALGTNDALSGDVTSQNYSANIQSILDYCISINPSANYIMAAPYGTSTVTRQTNLPAYRTALANVVALSKYSTRYVYYWNQFLTQGDPTTANDPNFTELTVGTQLHLRGDTGHVNLYNSLLAIIRSTNFAYALNCAYRL